MIHRPPVDWFALSPMLALLGAMALALLAALLPGPARRPVAALFTFLGFVGALVAAALLYRYSAHGHGVVADAIRRDRWSALAQMIVAGSGVLTVGVSYRERMSESHVAEYFAILAAAGAGMAFFVQANNLMTLFLGLEWFSIC